MVEILGNRIFVASSSFSHHSDRPLELLNSYGYEYTRNSKGRKLTESEILDSLQRTAGVIAGTETYSRKVLKRLPHLKVISRLGVGLDSIDLGFAEKNNIKVYTTQTTPALAVAELALGLILDLLRKITYQSTKVKNGTWDKKMGALLSGKTVGIIGLGTIGKKLVEITQGFGLEYLAHDLRYDGDFMQKYSITLCELDYLLAKSDVVSIHTNLTAETKSFIDFSALGKMKQSAILINSSRGQIVNEDDLCRALDHKLIGGAGLDVYTEEPYNGPLVKYDNVITTPHIGAYAKEIRMRMELEAAENLIEGLRETE